MWDTFNECGLDAYLHFGALLGLIRDGDLIPWDSDIDVACDAYAWNRRRDEVLAQLIGKGFTLHKRPEVYWTDDWAQYTGPVLGLQSKQRLVYRGLVVVFHFTVDGIGDASGFRLVKERNPELLGWFPARFTEHLAYLPFHGSRVAIPGRAEEWLDYVYGDWQTPDPTHAHRDETSTFRRNHP